MQVVLLDVTKPQPAIPIARSPIADGRADGLLRRRSKALLLLGCATNGPHHQLFP